ncbi:MAG: hypothetical protein QM723_35175 [Myxococcaceae bacterium]
MHQILAHSTESPQEAEELAARLEAAGIEVEIRELGAGALVGMLEATRRTWELWVPEPVEATSRKLIEEASNALSIEREHLDAELEIEATQAPPLPEATQLPEPKPVGVVTRNARIAGALMVGDVFQGIAARIVLSMNAEASPQPLEVYVRWGIEVVVAVALWNGSRGARLLSTAWVIFTGVYYAVGSLGLAPLAPLSEVTATLSLLLLLLGKDSVPRRFVGVTLWAVTSAVSSFPMTLAPAWLTKDAFVGQWHRHGEPAWAVVAFCADGRMIENTDKAAFPGQWTRVGLYEVETTGVTQNPERHLYAAERDLLVFLGARWDRDLGPSLCDEPTPR